MSNPSVPESQPASDASESFDNILSQYEKDQSRKAAAGGRQIQGTVVVVTADSVLLDIGFKSEGLLPLSAFQGESPKPGDRVPVSVQGRDPEGYYTLSRFKVEQPKDWTALEQAFASKSTITGTVTAAVKGGLSVDIGVRAFMPTSRSGARDAAEVEKLIGQEIRCRIIELDATEEDVVVDRRAVAEEEDRVAKDHRFSELKEGDVVHGAVRSLTDYGAFIDLGGVDALLHVGEIAWGRINKPADVLTVGQSVDVKVLKITRDAEKRRIAVGMKQLQPHPWDAIAGKYKVGDRIRGAVTRVVEFGAFVELEPGIEGLIHVSEMSWAKKVRIASDVVKPGEVVDAVVLGVNPAERRIVLGLKQALGDPWADAAQKYSVGSVVEGAVVSLTKFGAFVQLTEGVEGMVHVSDISAEKRIEFPQDVLRIGQMVKAQVLAFDRDKRQIKLGMKQLVPTSLDEYIAERKAGDVVTGRMGEISQGQARVELGEGIFATCRIGGAASTEKSAEEVKTDVSSLSAMLNARWKGNTPDSRPKPEEIRAGQIRSFKIVNLDAASKKIEVELA